MELLSVASKDFHPSVSVLGCIDKDATAIIICFEDVRNSTNAQHALRDLQLSRSRASLAVIYEPRKRRTSTDAGEESQLPIPDDLHRLVADFKLAPVASVVPTGTEAQIGASAPDILRNPAVALAVERAAIPLVRAAGHDEQRARRRPRLLDDHVPRDGDHGVVGSQEAAERVEALADRLDGAAIAWVCRQRVVSPGGLGERTRVD